MTLAPDWHRGAFMQIFVRAWRDADGDGIGDLRGLTQSLDYLHELGVEGLWLMPIHPCSDHDHGYAVTDYRGVNPDYGTLADVDALLAAAHARGIGVILDYVINHSSDRHPLFTESRASRANPKRDWYLWRDRVPAGWQIYGSNPWRQDPTGAYFGAFGAHMPDFNWRNPAVEAWHHDNLRFWLDRGVDGFRFDAVGHLVENGPDAWDCQPENHPIMARIRTLLDGYGARFMVAEAPGAPQAFARSCGSAFAFDLCKPLIDAARGSADALAAVARYAETAPPGMSAMLSNHDSFAGDRPHDQLEGDADALRRAAALYLLLPATPFVYYGEEIGMAGHPEIGADPGLRTPMSWDDHPLHAGFSERAPFRPPSPNARTHNVAAQRGDAESLHALYRALLALRRTRPSLRGGDFTVLACDGPRLVYRRRAGGETTVVSLAMAGEPAPCDGRLLFTDRAIAVYDVQSAPSR